MPIGANAAAWDRARQHVVMIGPDGAGAWVTWLWDGTSWTQAGAAPSPGRMGFDRTQQRIINVSTHVFSWDGASWTQGAAVTSAPTFAGAATAFDGVRNAFLVAGAWGSGTWEGRQSWQLVNASSPAVREYSAMAWDEGRSRMVLTGIATSAAQGTQTWEWDGLAWTRRVTATGPQQRDNHLMAWDSDRHVVVSYGGRIGVPVNDTWEWDGTAWAERRTVVSPGLRFPEVMVYDEARHRMVLFDGAVTWQLLP